MNIVYRVFEYGCLSPLANEDIALEQMKKRNIFWNSLVSIEREYRKKSIALIASGRNDTITNLEAKVADLLNEIKQRRKAARKNVDTTDLVNKIKELKEERKIVYSEQKLRRKELIEMHKPAFEALEMERREAVKNAQVESGLWWCNYDDVLKSYNVARVKAIKEGKELKYHSFDGSGKVSIRYQRGEAIEEVFASNTLLQIKPIDRATWDCPVRAERRKMTRSIVKIRVGSEGRDRRDPIWFELPFVMHRPIPFQSTIRSASVVREKYGNRFRYKLIIVTCLPQFVDSTADKGAVGVDLGWRRASNGIRVAYWCDAEGQTGKLTLPNDIIARFEKVNSLKSIRGRHFNNAKAVLAAWLRDKPTPEWLKEETKFLFKWNSPGKFKKLLFAWHQNRFPEDREMVAFIEEYLKRDLHLWQWEFNLRDKVQRRRRELYRIFAAELVKKYSIVILEKFDLRRVERKSEDEYGTRGALPASHNRTIASVSILRNVINTTFSHEGKYILQVEPNYTTVKCHKCGHVEKFDSKRQIYHTCSACGILWDQDYNAAVNILNKGLMKK